MSEKEKAGAYDALVALADQHMTIVLTVFGYGKPAELWSVEIPDDPGDMATEILGEGPTLAARAQPTGGEPA